MNKLSTLFTTLFILAVFANQSALAFVINKGIPVITLSDASKIKTRYRITSLGPSGFDSFASAINDAGMVVGGAYPTGTSLNRYRTFVFQNNRLRFLANFKHKNNQLEPIKNQINNSGRLVGTTQVNGVATPAIYNIPANRITLLPKANFAADTFFFGINDFGQLFGQLDQPNGFGQTDPFLLDKGQFINLGSLGGGPRIGVPIAINNQGVVVGWSNAPEPFNARPFLYEQGMMKNITPPDLLSARDVSGIATDINKLGQVVGTASGRKFITVGNSFEENILGFSFIYHKGRYTQFVVAKDKNTPDINTFVISNAAINNRGEVVGGSLIYRNGIVADLNTLIPAGSGWVLTDARDINNFGQIVGTGKKNGVTRAFLLTPVNLTRPQ